MEVNIALNYTKDDGWQIAYVDTTGNWHRVATEDFDDQMMEVFQEAAHDLEDLVVSSDEKLFNRWLRRDQAAQQPRDAKGRFIAAK